MSAKSVCVNDYEEKAKRILPKVVFDYYISGADDEETLADNVAAFSRWKFCPRVLRDVSKVDLSVSVLGQQINMPVCVAATAMQRMAHPDGETATARACRAEGTGMTLSSWATSTIEEVAAAAPGGLRWMQLYIYKDRDLTLSLVRRAEKAGYKGIFVTVDTPYLGRRRNDVRNQFKLPSNLSMVNFESPDLAFSSKENFGEDNGLALYVAQSIDPSLKWEDIAWLKSMTTLPVVLKGILTAEDAKEALKYGIDGILVSNHGARQLDGVLATGSPTPVLESYYPIGFLSYLASDEPHLFFGKYQELVWLIRSQIDALPEIVEAVGGRVQVFLDGGVRRGTDVLKALALGARAVFLGRPILWGLSCDGEKGVREILHLVREELRLAVALTGCRSLKEVSRSILKKSGISSRI